MKIKLNGIEIDADDTVTIEVSDDGKKVKIIGNAPISYPVYIERYQPNRLGDWNYPAWGPYPVTWCSTSTMEATK